jgi:two-component system, OmpR family, sensor histidine kinase KdpD
MKPYSATTPSPLSHSLLRRCLIAVLATAAGIAVLLPWHAQIALVNVAMLLLLMVALIAAYLGRGPAIVASLLCVLAFDLGFVPPRGSLMVHDAEYLIVFVVMLAVAVFVSQISGRLHQNILNAKASEQHQRSLFELAAALNATLRREQVTEVAAAFLSAQFDARLQLHAAASGVVSDRIAIGATDGSDEDAVVRSVEFSGLPAWIDDGDLHRPKRALLPLQGATRLRGVLDVRLPTRSGSAHVRDGILPVVASLVAAALERLHYVEVAARTQAEVEAERLRNTLLSALSHDLRTPLTVLYARADALREHTAEYPLFAVEAAAVCDEALRVNRLCEGLLDLARLRSAPHLLRRDWVALEELVGAALAGLRGVRGIEQVEVSLPEALPWLQLDAQMFERVIVNLIDNALKQGGAAQRVSVKAQVDGDVLRLTIANTGSRFPEQAQALLQPNARGDRVDAGSGFGLGLAICRAIVEAHGARIELCNRANAAEAQVILPLPAQAMPGLPADAVAVERGQ